jgi:hypothetical protein
MDRLTRRSFLSQALLAGAGASFFRPHEALTGIDLASSQASIDPEYDPGFIAGKVITSSKNELTVLDLDDQLRLVRLTPASHTWKQGLWDAFPLVEGDCVYARGTPGADGSIDLDSLWVDIKSLSTEVLAVGPTSFTVLTPSGQEETVLVAPFTRVETPSGWATGTAERLLPGQAIQLIGFGDDTGGPPTATTVYLYGEASVPGPQQVELPIVAAASQVEDPIVAAASSTFLVIGTWYCCGGVQACGSNDPNCLCCGGACGVCRSDRKQTAYPRLSTTGCEKCGTLDCCLALPRRACGASATIKNPCNSKSVNVRIQDCIGSTSLVNSVGCKNRHCRVLDLTPCAFSAIGSLSTGIINMNITV